MSEVPSKIFLSFSVFIFWTTLLVAPVDWILIWLNINVLRKPEKIVNLCKIVSCKKDFTIEWVAEAAYVMNLWRLLIKCWKIGFIVEIKYWTFEIWAKKGIFCPRKMGFFNSQKTAEKLWISPKIRIFGEISKEKILQII